jgi:signal transduction histidine kinase
MRLSIFFLLFICCFSPSMEAKNASPSAVKGVLDLRNISNSDSFVLSLNGEWEFYWKEMLKPSDFKVPLSKPYYGIVPSYWTDYPVEKIKTEKFGYATYRLIILLPASFRKSLGLDLPVFDSSYELYLNGNLMGGNGLPGKSAEETKPGYKKNFYGFIPQTDSVEIIINVANYDHRRGGFWLPARFGTSHEVMKRLANNWAGELAVMSLLMGFTVFFFFFFIISPKDKIMGFFSLAAFGLAIRPLFTSHYIILDIFDIPWVWIVRMEYIGLYIIIIAFLWFILNIYPSKFFNVIVWILTLIFSLFLILTLFLPVKIFSYSVKIYYPSVVLLFAYALYRSFLGLTKKNTLDIIYFLAFSLLVAGGINDIAVASGKSGNNTGYLLTYFIVLFVFIQAGLLLVKWVNDYNERKKLQNDLAFINKNLELLVDQRTQELTLRNAEIEKQNIMIATQNQKLSETIQVKNRIFSVIAHDLRAPVVNILYSLHLLKEKEYKEEYDTFVDSGINYAQNVIRLLENMLVWGRGQEDRIKVSPVKYDLADIVLTNLSIFKEIADKKDIPLHFTCGIISMAFFDKDLMDIIIRNLLSNAIKYTPRGGKITIFLNDEVSAESHFNILKICDTGIGIPESKLKEFFESGETESTLGTENEKGTGLGLKLCNELIKLNNGNLHIDSREGQGTCIRIAVPVT